MTLYTHDAPFLKINNINNLHLFLKKNKIEIGTNRSQLISEIADAFSKIPYENLTKIIKSDNVISPRSAMRYPDELLSDYLKWGTGGTCFSLTAATIAVYNAVGIEAHPVLADRYYGPDTHCGLVIVTSEGLLLLDPGYLLFAPTLLPKQLPVCIDTGYNRMELVPLPDGNRVELYTIVKGNRKLRLIYKKTLVSPETFEKAWEQSFAWEMMTYPVLTRVSAGQHQYIQGNKLSIRTDERTERSNLSIESEINFITQTIGISREIVKKAFGVISNGRN